MAEAALSMRVGINARGLRASSLRGWNRYAVNLLGELPALGVELVLYADAPIHAVHLGRLVPGSYTVRISPPRLYPIWEQVWLPRQGASDEIKVLHTPFNFGLPWWSSCPRVLTLHDAIDEVYYRARRSWRESLSPSAIKTRFYHWGARRAADHIITVSEHARSDIERHLGVSPSKISVIYEAADKHFNCEVQADTRRSVRQHHDLRLPYVLYVGGLEGRKNFGFLLRAFAASRLNDVMLVSVGGDNTNREKFQHHANRIGVERLRFLGEVDDEELAALYAEALAFVYPSEYEGFGLQLCEAMAAGCPVFAARAGSLPEVLGSGGELFGLDDPNELAAQLVRAATDPSFRDDLISRGHRRALQFSWRRAAAETFAVYRAVTGGGAAAGLGGHSRAMIDRSPGREQ